MGEVLVLHYSVNLFMGEVLVQHYSVNLFMGEVLVLHYSVNLFMGEVLVLQLVQLLLRDQSSMFSAVEDRLQLLVLQDRPGTNRRTTTRFKRTLIVHPSRG